MKRLPRVTPDCLNEAQRSLYESIAAGRRSEGPTLFRTVGDDGALEGPFAAFLLNPQIGARLSALGEAIRYHGALPDEVREMLILSVARDRGSEYEWYAHSAVARHLGVSDAVLHALRDGGGFPEVPENVVTALDFYGCVKAWRRVPDELYTRAMTAFGADGLVEIACLIFYYDMLAALLSIFDIDLPDGVPPVFYAPVDGT